MPSNSEVPGNAELASLLDGDFTSETAEVNGVRLHYVRGGQGDPLFLLPGWPETWWEYRKVMPALARRFTVHAIDIRGMGGSAKPESGFEKKSMAADIRALAAHIGYERISIAGHGIGSMVAYAFAANHPEATDKLVMLNTTHIDESYYGFTLMPRPGTPGPHRWWLAFNTVEGFPEKVLAHNYRPMTDFMFDLSLLNPGAVGEFDRRVYAEAYSSPAAVRASSGWFKTYQQDIADFASYEKIRVPVLGLAYGGFYAYMSEVLPRHGVDVRVAEITDSRNYLVEEQPEQVTHHLLEFLG
ncbi:alpha/beta hydrolase [Streptomyces sp. NA04227]|uniref:alpha/beta fold hydrolase n=1 Tax=Streptomyces sp. NA04227 TaxID=2742136 RepID=UPI001590D81B|nr:alpha/beta hydrolase [Streptomyces sp. NA04227]QKW06582.1 alpha/beta hydrolase [Streptomyces sp. NA04227]